MRNETIYLLYNTNASDIKLHAGPTLGRGRKSSEYEDKDEFVILYGPEDERKYTDIKILSKTKLRSKSTSALSNIPKGQVEGILLRRTNSLQEFQDFILRRIPTIRPLLSDTEITRLQRIQEECKLRRYIDFGGAQGSIESPWSPTSEYGLSGMKGDFKIKPEVREDIRNNLKPIDAKIMERIKVPTPSNIDQVNKEKKIVDSNQGHPRAEENKDTPGRGKRSPVKSELDEKPQRKKRSKGKSIDSNLKEPSYNKQFKSKNKKEIMEPPIKKKKENEDKIELGKAKNKKKIDMENDNVYINTKSKTGRNPRPRNVKEVDKTKKKKESDMENDDVYINTKSKTGINPRPQNVSEVDKAKKKKKSLVEENNGNVGSKYKSSEKSKPQIRVKSELGEAKKKKTSLLEKDDVYVGRKSKIGEELNSQNSNEHYSAEKPKKIKEKSDMVNTVELTKHDRKGSHSSKSESSAKATKSGKDLKSFNIDHDYKSKSDTKSLTKDLGSKQENIGKDRIDVEHIQNGKGDHSISVSSKTKGSVKQKELKRDTARKIADDLVKPRKQNEEKKDAGGRSSNGVENTNSPRSKKLAGQKHEGMSPDYSKSTDFNTKDKRGRIKSTLSAKTRSVGKKSDESLSFPATSKKKESLHQTHKRSRNRSMTLEYMIKYVLSNPIFIKLGWTLPTANKTLSRLVIFNAIPANPELYCFRKREEAVSKRYPSGNVAVNLQPDGRGEILYPSGCPAMLIKKTSKGMILIIYSDKKKEPSVDNSNKARLLGLFDSFGHGVVYDKLGKKIINFNQFEGIYHNQVNKAPYKWRWKGYKELAQNSIKEIMNFIAKENKNPHDKGKKTSGSSVVKSVANKRSSEEKEYDKLLAELPFPTPPKSKIKRNSCSSVFKSVIFKITDEMTLRINSQDNVTIVFTAGKILQRIDLGVRIDPDTVVSVEELALDKIEEIPCVFEALLKTTPSLEKLNKELNAERKPKLKKRHSSNVS